MNNELKPCPSCGKKVYVYMIPNVILNLDCGALFDWGAYSLDNGYAVICSCGKETEYYSIRNEAIKAWNTRYQEEQS